MKQSLFFYISKLMYLSVFPFTVDYHLLYQKHLYLLTKISNVNEHSWEMM